MHNVQLGTCNYFIVKMFKKLDGFYSIELVAKSSLAAPAMIAYNVVCLIGSLIWPFLYCYFATFASDRVAALSQTVFNTNWFDWPPEIQKYFILVIARSQKQFEFTGLGLLGCSLEVLGKVRALICSSGTKILMLFFFYFSSLELHVPITLYSENY